MLVFWRKKEASSRMSAHCSSAPGIQHYSKTSSELQFIYIIIEVMYWKRHIAGFKAIPRYCLAHLEAVRDQPRCPDLEMSTAGLAVRPSVQPGSCGLVPDPRSSRLMYRGLQHWVVSQGALLYCHFS